MVLRAWEDPFPCETPGLKNLPAKPDLKLLPQSRERLLLIMGWEGGVCSAEYRDSTLSEWERKKLHIIPLPSELTEKKKKKNGGREGGKKGRKKKEKKKQQRAIQLKTLKEEEGVWHQNPLYILDILLHIDVI